MFCLYAHAHHGGHIPYIPASFRWNQVAYRMAHESPEGGCLPKGPNIVIIGAGVVGLSCAHQILAKLGDNVHITVISEGFTNQTTSFGSGGLWEPYQIAGNHFSTLSLFSFFTLYSLFFLFLYITFT